MNWLLSRCVGLTVVCGAALMPDARAASPAGPPRTGLRAGNHKCAESSIESPQEPSSVWSLAYILSLFAYYELTGVSAQSTRWGWQRAFNACKRR
jgi:hypothetical protein